MLRNIIASKRYARFNQGKTALSQKASPALAQTWLFVVG